MDKLTHEQLDEMYRMILDLHIKAYPEAYKEEKKGRKVRRV